MKIVEDSPGSRLVLKGQTVSVPVEAGIPMFAVVSLFFLVPGGIAWYAKSLFPLLFMFGAGVVFSQIWGAIRRSLVAFDVNGPAGEIRISWARLLGGEIEEERVPLADLDTICVRLMAGGSGGGGDAGVRIDLKLRSGLTRTVDLTVESMSRHEEVADFALRIGAAARLPTSRVIRNDPREVEIELTGGSEPKTRDPLPAPASPASPADYSRDRVEPEARLAVAREKTVAFTPPAEFGAYRVDDPHRDLPGGHRRARSRVRTQGWRLLERRKLRSLLRPSTARARCERRGRRPLAGRDRRPRRPRPSVPRVAAAGHGPRGGPGREAAGAGLRRPDSGSGLSALAAPAQGFRGLVVAGTLDATDVGKR